MLGKLGKVVFMKGVLLLIMLSICQFSYADAVADMESALAAGDIQRAKATVDAMYKNKAIVTGPTAAYLSGYSQLVDIFSAVSEFNARSERFEQSRRLQDFRDLQYSHQMLASMTERMKAFSVSEETISLLNYKLSETNSKMESARTIKSQIEVAQAEEKRVFEEKQRLEEAARQAAWEIEQEKINKEMEANRIASEKSQAAFTEKMAARKKECGKDFESPRVGMSLERAKHCVGNLKLKAQVNRPDGVLSTYWAGNIFVHVMNGKIVSWGDLR